MIGGHELERQSVASALLAPVAFLETESKVAQQGMASREVGRIEWRTRRDRECAPVEIKRRRQHLGAPRGDGESPFLRLAAKQRKRRACSFHDRENRKQRMHQWRRGGLGTGSNSR